ncbi:hypothetical protein ACQP2T_44030 [Nonomuraea sp. CA-143628]|uniref:WXG100-like domain-containing protein n=1 Tax=Nonomuraea sp. CA-143628 TaxID=3239997 RepID=UPI003D907781
MSVTLPPEASGMLAILGVPWPNVDEDEIRKDASAWRTVLAGTVPAGAAADAQVRRTQQVYGGESGTALAAHWSAAGNSDGHLAQVTSAAKVAPVALDGTAAVVTAVKVAVGTQAAFTAVKVGRALLAGGPFGGSLASAEMFFARRTMAKILREGGESTGRGLAPVLSRRATETFRRVVQNLRRPGGGGGGPRLAGAGGRNVPTRSPAFKGDRLDENPGIARAWRKPKEDKPPLNQENRNPHTSKPSKSKRNKHENAAAHGGRRKIPKNPNKKPKKPK